MNNDRIIGLDIARALAIFGMILVNLKIAMNVKTGNSVLISLADFFQGKSSALFVVLAGIGITLMTNSARISRNRNQINSARIALVKRGIILIMIGLVFSFIWQADILHFYGFYFLIASFIIFTSDKTVMTLSVVIMLAFPLLMVFFDYDKNWNWVSFEYHGFWSIFGMLRNVLYNGFHPIFPWCAFLFFGLWLGRQNLSSNKIRKKLLIYSSSTWSFIEIIFYFLRNNYILPKQFMVDSEDIGLLFSLSAMPPFPQYVISAASLSVVVIMSCLIIASRYQNIVLSSLAKTGRLSLTWYILHVIIGMGLLQVIGKLENQTIQFSLLITLLFCLIAIAFSVVWLNNFKYGPLEWFFRKLSKFTNLLI